MKNLARSALIMAALAGSMAPAVAAAESREERRFEREETKDAFLERQARFFERMDLDGDGKVTPEERRELRESMRAKKAEGEQDRQWKKVAEEKRRGAVEPAVPD